MLHYIFRLDYIHILPEYLPLCIQQYFKQCWQWGNYCVGMRRKREWHKQLQILWLLLTHPDCGCKTLLFQPPPAAKGRPSPHSGVGRPNAVGGRLSVNTSGYWRRHIAEGGRAARRQRCARSAPCSRDVKLLLNQSIAGGDAHSSRLLLQDTAFSAAPGRWLMAQCHQAMWSIMP